MIDEIDEKDKQKILTGALAKTKSGKKAKCVLKSTHKANSSHPYLFIVSDNDKCYPDWYNENLESKQDKFNSSIVELWRNDPIPFNLTQALAGKPIALKHKPAEKCYLVGESRSETYAKGVYIVQQQISDDDFFFPISIETLSENYIMWQEP